MKRAPVIALTVALLFVAATRVAGGTLPADEHTRKLDVGARRNLPALVMDRCTSLFNLPPYAREAAASRKEITACANLLDLRNGDGTNNTRYYGEWTENGFVPMGSEPMNQPPTEWRFGPSKQTRK